MSDRGQPPSGQPSSAQRPPSIQRIGQQNAPKPAPSQAAAQQPVARQPTSVRPPPSSQQPPPQQRERAAPASNIGQPRSPAGYAPRGVTSQQQRDAQQRREHEQQRALQYQREQEQYQREQQQREQQQREQQRLDQLQWEREQRELEQQQLLQAQQRTSALYRSSSLSQFPPPPYGYTPEPPPYSGGVQHTPGQPQYSPQPAHFAPPSFPPPRFAQPAHFAPPTAASVVPTARNTRRPRPLDMPDAGASAEVIAPPAPAQLLAAGMFLGVPLFLATLVVAVLALRSDPNPAAAPTEAPQQTAPGLPVSGQKKAADAPALKP